MNITGNISFSTYGDKNLLLDTTDKEMVRYQWDAWGTMD